VITSPSAIDSTSRHIPRRRRLRENDPRLFALINGATTRVSCLCRQVARGDTVHRHQTSRACERGAKRSGAQLTLLGIGHAYRARRVCTRGAKAMAARLDAVVHQRKPAIAGPILGINADRFWRAADASGRRAADGRDAPGRAGPSIRLARALAERYARSDPAIRLPVGVVCRVRVEERVGRRRAVDHAVAGAVVRGPALDTASFRGCIWRRLASARRRAATRCYKPGTEERGDQRRGTDVCTPHDSQRPAGFVPHVFCTALDASDV
jgi:hypothetical protein